MTFACDLDDDVLEECIEGSSSIDLLREIIEKTMTKDGTVNVKSFGEWFAYGLEGFIDADPDTYEWEASWNINRQWGESIAENINEVVKEEQ